ncbi:MAG TPA: 4-hydroxyphenylacetate 3-hydroxylase N-terminal domain-containing protein, partial [Stellaceae bacterium]|nr:4-hydroxyphenylacetate 3-hydroxylase N-terminal domain-containing protein [Stellaceae bacterium]
MRPEDRIADKKRPYTGAEYRESLRDGRNVYIDGERVADVTTHPAFRNSVRSLSRLYDSLHDPKQRDVLTAPTDTGSGGYTFRYFRYQRSREEMIKSRDAMAAWSRMTYGWMGRTPDYKAAFTNTLGANADYYGPFAENARRWYKRAQETCPFMNHAIVNPPVDRHLPAEKAKDVFVSVDRETDGGIIVSGAKVVATSAAMTHYNFMGQSSKTATEDLDMSLMFLVPIDAPGLKLFCRTSYELAAKRNGTPFDYP